ncbi:MAG: transglutaminase family protein [Rhodospirillaceae bacterium]
MPLPDRPDPAAPPALVRYRARHITRYDYGEDVPVSHHLVHLAPCHHPRQRCRRSQLTVDPMPAVRADYSDYFDNPVSYIAVQEPHRRLEITSELEIEVRAPDPFDPGATPPREELRALTRARGGVDEATAIGQFVFDSALIRTGPALFDYAIPSFRAGRPIGEALIDLTARIFSDFSFDPTATTVSTPLEEVLAKRRGVCQDFAHLQIGCLRSLGVPARYVSGYLRTTPPPGQPRLVGADQSHAWVSAWCGGDLWLDLCPTNGRLADADFITLARGRDYGDVSPVRGVITSSADQGLSVSVDVEVIDD